MAMETAAAILTRLIFEQNNDFRTRLSNAPGDESSVVALIMPLFRRVLSQLQEEGLAHDRFPSSIAPSSLDPGH